MRLEDFLHKTQVLLPHIKNIFPEDIEVETLPFRVKVLVKTEMSEELFEKIVVNMKKLDYYICNIQIEDGYIAIYFGMKNIFL